MSLFSDIGSAISSFLGGNQKKKDPNQPQPTVQAPQVRQFGLNQQNTAGNTPQAFVSPIAPKPLQLGGVNRARDEINAGGAGAPFAPAVIAQAKSTPAPQPQVVAPKPDSPLLTAAKGFYGGVNDVGSLVGSVVGSVLPVGDANIYSDKGRQNLLHNLQNQTYDPATGKWFSAGAQSVQKLQNDSAAGNLEATAGDLGGTLLNAASVVPVDSLFTAGKAALTGTVKDVAREALKGGAIGGTFGAGMGATSAMQQNADPLSVLQSVAESGILGGALGAAIPGAAGALNRARNPLARTLVREGDEVGDEQVGNASANSLEQPEAQPVAPTPREAGSPITSSPTTAKAPAITSPNRPAPTVAVPQPFEFGAAPVTARPEVAAPVVQAPVAAAEDAPKAAVQQVQDALDQQTAAPKATPELQAVAPLEAPGTTAAKNIATDATPASQQAITEQVAKDVAADAPTTASPEDLGTIAQKAVSGGNANPEKLSQAIDTASAQYAADHGVNIEKVNELIQKANRNKVDSLDKAGLNEAEQDWFLKDQQEKNFLRDRADISGKNGQQKFYSPQQRTDTEFDPNFVNENKRTGGIPLNELDYSSTPSKQYNQRYADAPAQITAKIADTIENIPDTSAESGFRPSGVKLDDEAKNTISSSAAKYVETFDKRLNVDDPKALQSMNEDVSKAADDVVKEALTYVKSQPQTAETKAVIAELQKGRSSYVHTYMEANMLGQVQGRLADQINKGIVEGVDKLTGRGATALTEKLTGVKLQPKTAAGRAAAKEWSRGTTLSQVKQNYRTNVSNLSAASDSFIGKGIARLRAGSTAATQAAGLETSSLRKTVGYYAREAEDAGLTSKEDINKYISDKVKSGEVGAANQGTESITNQNVALSTSKDFSKLQSNNLGLHTLGQWIDNLPKAIIEKHPDMPAPARKVLESGINRFITGFAKVTGTAASKGIDITTGGIPTMYRGFKALKSADTDAEKIAAARSVQQGITELASAGAFTAIGVALKDSYTGNYPTDPSERARWEREGIQPNTFRIPAGNGYLSIQPGRLGAYSFPVVLGASIASGKSENPAETLAGLGSQFVQNFGIDQVGNLFNTAGSLLNGDASKAAKSLEQIGPSIADGLIPLGGLLNETGNVLDRTKRDTSGLANGLAAKIPGVRNLVAPKEDTFGNPVENTNIGFGSWLTGSSGPKDAVDGEISRLAAAGSEVTPPKGSDNATKAYAGLLLNDPVYTSADDKGKAEILKNVLAGTSTKDIDASLSDVDKQALVDGKILGDKKDAWLDDNSNKSNYQTALLNNAKANGTLTNADKDITNPKGLQYKAVAAQVDKAYNADYALKNNYGDTSQSEFKSLLNPKSDSYDPDAAQKLYDYDQARVKAGLPPKYNLSAAQKAAAKGSGSSKNFAFASMPSSLTGTASGGGKSGNGGYAEATSLFKPIADLQAPATVAIPKSRNISVKPGVQV